MNYVEWAEEYDRSALRILQVIDKKKLRLNDDKLSAESRKKLVDEIAQYRRIYYELVDVGDTLRLRAGVIAREA